MQVEQVSVIGNRELRIAVRAGEAMHGTGPPGKDTRRPRVQVMVEPGRKALLVGAALPGVKQRRGAARRHAPTQQAAHSLFLVQTAIASVRPLQDERSLLLGAVFQ